MANKKQSAKINGAGNGEWLDPAHALSRYRPALVARSHLPEPTAAPFRYGTRTAKVAFLIPDGIISEVVEKLVVTPVPNTVDWFTGLTNLRGTIVPVFDLRKLFGGANGDSERLLVMDKGERAVALPIDQLPAPVGIGTIATHLPPVPEILSPYVKSAYLDDAETWLDVDFPALFDALGERVAR